MHEISIFRLSERYERSNKQPSLSDFDGGGAVKGEVFAGEDVAERGADEMDTTYQYLITNFCRILHF